MSAFQIQGPAGGPTLLDYTQITSDVTISSTDSNAANTIVTAAAVTCDGTTPILIQFFSFAVEVGSGASGVGIVLYMDGSALDVIQFLNTAAAIVPVSLFRRFTPSAGSHTFSIRGYKVGNNGTVNAGTGAAGNEAPAFIRITTDPS